MASDGRGTGAELGGEMPESRRTGFGRCGAAAAIEVERLVRGIPPRLKLERVEIRIHLGARDLEERA